MSRYRAMPLTSHSTRRALTLAELALSLSVMAMLMGGLASAMVLATRALPAGDDTLGDTARATRALDIIAQDLLCARAITHSSAHALEFTVSDRSGDGDSETIRYEWSGTAGDPLIREYYTGTSSTANLLEIAYAFDLSYDYATETETQEQEVTEVGEEVTLAYFDGWGGCSPSYMEFALSPDDWIGEVFYLRDVPAGATAVNVTHVMLTMRTLTGMDETITVGIHSSRSGGPQYRPNLETIGTPATHSGGDLTPSFNWIDFAYSDVTLTELDAPYAVLAKGGASDVAEVQYLYCYWADDNGCFTVGSHDAGSAWTPSSYSLHRYDLPFYVLGQYVKTGMGEVEVERSFLRTVHVELQAGVDSAGRAETDVSILNQPEVVTP